MTKSVLQFRHPTTREVGEGFPIAGFRLLSLKVIRHSSLCVTNVSGHRHPCNCGARAE